MVSLCQWVTLACCYRKWRKCCFPYTRAGRLIKLSLFSIMILASNDYENMIIATKHLLCRIPLHNDALVMPYVINPAHLFPLFPLPKSAPSIVAACGSSQRCRRKWLKPENEIQHESTRPLTECRLSNHMTKCAAHYNFIELTQKDWMFCYGWF